MQIATSYFYQIRHFKQNMIPVSTAVSDPVWYRPPQDKNYYIDKRGIINGLRYEPLIVQKQIEPYCICCNVSDFVKQDQDLLLCCNFLKEYKQLLYTTIDLERTLKAFEFCGNKFKKELRFKEDPIIVLIVYEIPDNPCSERAALQELFNCKELEYPII